MCDDLMVTCLANLSSSQVAYWDADSVPDTDDVGARVMAVTAVGPTSVAGKIGNAWRLSGSGGLMSTADEAGIRLVGTSFTIRFWIFPFLLDNVQNTIIVKYSGITGWGFTASATGNLQLVMGNGSTLLFVEGPVLTINTWHHVVATYSTTTNTVVWYFNGSASGILTNPQLSISSNTSALTIGGTYPMHFDFDEFGIWGFPWTQCEVTADYNSSAGQTHPFS